MQVARRVYHWASSKASIPSAPLWLGLIFLTELFLFLPLDAMLMLFCIQNPARRYLYAAIATLASVVIALIGYALGCFLWDTLGPYIVGHVISVDFFNRLVQHYNQHEGAAVFIGSLLPIPFKAVTLSAGFCQLSLITYLFAVAAARAVRFFVIADLMGRWGSAIKDFIDRRFNHLLIVLGVKIALSVSFFWFLGH